ncbi:MAG: glycoside hydrolase family 43 protein [Marinilabiliaceae bacterium]
MILLMSGVFAGFFYACNDRSSGSDESPGATFHWFEYQGDDEFYNNHSLDENEYFNPVLSGFYPDPSVCRKGDDYYLVNSTFSFFPGVPIFHSTDLVNWKQLGHVLNRPLQLNITNQEISEGIFAPAISYNPNNDLFYMVTTFVGGMGNFFVTAEDPAGPWSDPVKLNDLPGIDPSFFFDDNGQAWLVHNATPEGDPQYEGHRAIWIQEFDPKAGKLVGERKMIIDGGHDITEEPVWVEGPHIYKVNGYYYLMAAEGGTGENHSEVIFRSREVTGPYEPYEGNPILTQRNLPSSRPNPVTSTGHADIIETPDGDWWAVFLGCRPYKDNHFNTGRETFLLPVEWKDGWPVILEEDKPAPLVEEASHTQRDTSKNYFPSGNFKIRDDFAGDSLALCWNFIRTPREKWYDFNDHGIRLDFRPVSFREKKNPSFIGRRQQHQIFSASTAVSLKSGNSENRAGLLCFRTERHNYFLGAFAENGNLVAFVEKTIQRDGEKVKKRLGLKKTSLSADETIYLKVDCDEDMIDFLISEDQENWEYLAESQDAAYLSTATAGGFVGTYIGMYAGRE